MKLNFSRVDTIFHFGFYYSNRHGRSSSLVPCIFLCWWPCAWVVIWVIVDRATSVVVRMSGVRGWVKNISNVNIFLLYTNRNLFCNRNEDKVAPSAMSTAHVQMKIDSTLKNKIIIIIIIGANCSNFKLRLNYNKRNGIQFLSQFTRFCTWMAF